MPPEKVYNKLAEIILKLSKNHNSPNFMPHVTLLGSIFSSEKKMFLKTSQLVTFLHPFEIELTKVDYLDEYFRCLFIRAVGTKELIHANLKAREIFNRQRDQKFMPHLSLMYGNFDTKLKEKIIAEIGREFNLKFKIKSIHLISDEGEPEEWFKIKEFIL